MGDAVFRRRLLRLAELAADEGNHLKDAKAVLAAQKRAISHITSSMPSEPASFWKTRRKTRQRVTV